MEVAIRNVNEEEWKEFKATAVRKGLTVGTALNLAIREWTKNRKQKTKMDFFRSGPVEFEEGGTSRDIDEVLYG